MEPRREEPGLIGFEVPILNAPAFIEISARTGSDFGLDTFATGFHHLLPVDTVNVLLWGTPASKQKNDPTSGCPSASAWRKREPVRANRWSRADPNRFRPTRQPPPSSRIRRPAAFPLTASVESSPTTERPHRLKRPGRGPQVASNWRSIPLSDGATHDHPGRHSNRPGRQSTRAADPEERKSSLGVRAKGHRRHPPRGLLDQPERCRRQDLLQRRPAANFGTSLAAECPEISKIGSIEIDSVGPAGGTSRGDLHR